MNTLITEFKGEISDKTLPRYDIVSLEFPTDYDGTTVVDIKRKESGSAIIGSDESTEVNVLNASGTVIGTTPYNVPYNASYTRTFKMASGTKFYIEGLKDLIYFSIGNVAGTGIVQLKEDSKDLNVLFNKSDLYVLNVRRQDSIKCNIETLVGNKTGFKEIFISDNTNSNIYGNIICLSNNIELTKFVMYSSNISGNVENLADAMVANGRTGGILYINVESTSCIGVPGFGLKADIHFTNDTTTYPRGWYTTVHS